MFSPSQNAEFYRFGHLLSFSPASVQGRPLGMLSKFNPETFLIQRLMARFGSNSNMIGMNLFLPVFLQWTQIQNELLLENEKHGYIEATMTDELRLLMGRAMPSLVAMITHTMIEAGLDLLMLREDIHIPSFLSSRSHEENLAWRQSIVRQSDYALKLKSHFYANIVEKFYLPRRWTYIFVGPETSAEETQVFSSPVSFGCAFEDHLKRYFLVNVADSLTFTLGQVMMFVPAVRSVLATREVVHGATASDGNASSSRLRHGQHRVTRQAPPAYVWKEQPAPKFKDAFIAIRNRFWVNGKNLILSAVGAAIGSALAGGHGGACEFWCSRLLPLFIDSIPSIRNWRKKMEAIAEQLEEKRREIEASSQREMMRNNDNNNNNNNNDKGYDQDVEAMRAVTKLAMQNYEQRKKAAAAAASASGSATSNGSSSDEQQQQQNNQDDEEEEEERRRYFNETQTLFAQRQVQLTTSNYPQMLAVEQEILNEGEVLNSPVNQHRPLQHPEQRQIVLEDE